MLYKTILKYAFIAFAFMSCNNVSRRNDAPKISTEVLDTVKSISGKIAATPVLFETAFIKGTTQRVNDKILNLYGVTIGKIKIGSGHIVACDPLHIDEYGKPFTQVFPTGEFPFQLSIAKSDEAEAIAFARIYFNDEPVERWEFALLKGQPAIPVGGEKMYGYSVDAGIGIFMDEEAIKALDINKLTQSNAALYTEMNQHYHRGWRYTMYNFGNHNLASFTTGLGDGCYATYIGYDATGKPCRLVTDLGLFDWKPGKE